MSFDLSRVRFDARQDFLGVIMQQGRVQLDADWNEWVAELVRRLQTGSLDTFGGTVVPRITPDGFRIEADGGALGIGRGRIYVDGILAENHGGAPEAWDPRLAELTGTSAVDYTAQPYYPDPPALPEGGPHLIFLDVWQRDVTALEVPDLIEKAVGVDTTGRRQTVWQVKVLPNVGDVTCATPDADIPGWSALTSPSPARLSIDTGTPTFVPSPCEVPPAAGYRGLENQLYRVEVHQGGPLGTATFKWSRDNGTVASRVTHINPERNRITVDSVGRDDVSSFHDGEWVEVTDDVRALKNLPGELRRIRVASGVDATLRTLTFEAPLTNGLFPTDAQQATQPARNTIVRRWDQSGQVRREDGTAMGDVDAGTGEILIPPAGTRIFLEHGILVEFSLASAGGHFRPGDHWVASARSVDASIERLDRAPPLGVHHHYARLAVVSFPDTETDCRTLWPPVSEGEGCDCGACVSAEGHNSGSATIQQAIDSLAATGGTLCLGIGTYRISRALLVNGARSLRIRGQGFGTLLVGDQPGTVFEIANGTGVALSNLTVIGSVEGATSAVITATNVIDLSLDHVNVLGLGSGDGVSVGLGLSGSMLGAKITNAAIVAERGIATLSSRERRYLLTAELHVAESIFLCSQRAVSFDGSSLHYGTTQLRGNLVLGGTQGAIVATGAVLPGSTFSVADNVIYSSGDGIRAGVDGLAIERNSLRGLETRDGCGIVLGEGLDPRGIGHVRVSANRIAEFGHDGVRVEVPVETGIFTENVIENLGHGAFVMDASSRAGWLRFSGNQCRMLGRSLDDPDARFAALQLVQVEHGDVLDNEIAHVAEEALTSPGIDALRGVAVGSVRIAGNRILAVGPVRTSAAVAGVRVAPPFERLTIEDNHIERSVALQGLPIPWRTIDVGLEARGAGNVAAVTSFVVGSSAFLLTRTRVLALPVRLASASIRGNQLRGLPTNVPLNRCESVESCSFTGNHCAVTGQSEQPRIAALSARLLDASHNHLSAPGDQVTLELKPIETKRAIVLGNISTGNILVSDGSPVPADIAFGNIIGV